MNLRSRPGLLAPLRGLFFLAASVIFHISFGHSAMDVHAAERVTAHNGLFFVHGRFVPGPYEIQMITRRFEIVIVVQGTEIDRFLYGADEGTSRLPLRHPGKFNPPDGVEDLSESGLTHYLNQLLEFSLTQGDLTSALDVVEHVALASALVSRVVREEGGLLLFDKKGDPYGISRPSTAQMNVLSLDEAAACANRAMVAYGELLARGGAILVFKDGEVFCPRDRVGDVLLPSLRALNDPRQNLALKTATVSKLWEDHPLVTELIANYESSPELWRHVELRPNGEWR